MYRCRNERARFFAELKRRNVYKVAAAYAAYNGEPRFIAFTQKVRANRTGLETFHVRFVGTEKSRK